MQVITKNAHSFLQFELLLPYKNVSHASFKKHGELNPLSIQKTLNLPKSAWISQVHGNHIVEVAQEGLAGEADALATDRKDIALCIHHADCQAALMYDPAKHVAAAVHCGWKGATKKIYTKTIDFLEQRYGCKREDLIVCISPSLGPSASQFINYEQEFPSSFLAYQFKPLYFDLWQISKDELIDAGISLKNIEIAQICTFSNPLDYHSYRYDKTKNRLVTLISLL